MPGRAERRRQDFVGQIALVSTAPVRDEILYDGRSVSEYDLGSLRRRMGCLFQDFVKYLLTVRDNVAFGAESEPEDCVIQRAIEQAGATDLVQSAGGLDAQLGKQFGGTDLSGGEWQKLALARALIRDVDFLVLDEPSASWTPMPSTSCTCGSKRWPGTGFVS